MNKVNWTIQNWQDDRNENKKQIFEKMEFIFEFKMRILKFN